MSIEIINVTKKWSDALHHYELRINKDCLAKFTHVPDEGLSVCLHNAIQAYEQSLTSPTSTDRLTDALCKCGHTYGQHIGDGCTTANECYKCNCANYRRD